MKILTAFFQLVRWFFGVTFLLFAIAFSTDSIPSALLFLAMALILIPLTERALFSKLNLQMPRVAKIGILSALFVALIVVTPPPSEEEVKGETTKNDEVSPSHKPTQKPTATNAPKPTDIPPVDTPTPKPPTETPVPLPTNTPLPPPTWTPAPLPTNLPVEQVQEQAVQQQSGGFVCNCGKTCSNMGCDEAYFQLNQCGCSARDGDNDGIPCEAQCR